MSDLDTIRERHVVHQPRVGNVSGHTVDYCEGCRAMWPCETRVVLDALEALDTPQHFTAEALTTQRDAARADADRLAEALRDADAAIERTDRSVRPDLANAHYAAREALRLHDEAKS